MVDSGATHNFITEAEARRLRLRWDKDSERMKVVNFGSLPIVGLVKQTVIKLGGWKGPVDFVVVNIDDFDVVLGMEFLLEHQVIPMLSAKCLVITGSFSTVVQANIRQPNGFKMISVMQLDNSRVQEEPPSVEILHGTLEKLWKTVPKGTLRTDQGIESPSEAKAPAKNAYCTTPPKLAVLRKQSKKLLGTGYNRLVQAPWGASVLSLKKKNRSLRRCIDRQGLEATCVTGLRAYEFPVAPFNLTDAKRGKCCSVQRKINVLGHIVEFHQIEGEEEDCCNFTDGFLQRGISSLTELLKEEDIQWGGNLECQAAFNGLKQATIEEQILGSPMRPSLPKLRSSNSTGTTLKFAELKRKEQMADIVRVCLEEASRSMEERVDQKRCPIEFEWMPKLSINDATTSCDYLSTWNRKKIEESKKSLLTK
ncbi:uncharacterized protein E5676_scaffold726G00110 [Cucumis melo var. makuwa]|uniref:Asp_protease_2 domain-containing protein n=1 Tax=Cucumis melo var. makuwa TaxID=1194695 RepID=A0A5A7UB44_CUCMM|nr:uncharacterized protein E6C27_scaffold560G00460 [Cucumis melo var. makuwa]TYJ95685.1 uncharacterized protein E5676_scaffold726G00110 [Cucumis melo var. makuwa]